MRENPRIRHLAIPGIPPPLSFPFPPDIHVHVPSPPKRPFPLTSVVRTFPIFPWLHPFPESVLLLQRVSIAGGSRLVWGQAEGGWGVGGWGVAEGEERGGWLGGKSGEGGWKGKGVGSRCRHMYLIGLSHSGRKIKTRKTRADPVSFTN